MVPDLTAGFRIGFENVIFLWSCRISGVKKYLVLLISQKDYEHIKKYEAWDRFLPVNSLIPFRNRVLRSLSSNLSS